MVCSAVWSWDHPFLPLGSGLGLMVTTASSFHPSFCVHLNHCLTLIFHFLFGPFPFLVTAWRTHPWPLPAAPTGVPALWVTHLMYNLVCTYLVGLVILHHTMRVLAELHWWGAIPVRSQLFRGDCESWLLQDTILIERDPDKKEKFLFLVISQTRCTDL